MAHIYDTPDRNQVGRLVGSALLNYFQRLMVFSVQANRLDLIGHAGQEPDRPAIALDAMPVFRDRLSEPGMRYGPLAADTRLVEFCDMFGFDEPKGGLVATIETFEGPCLAVYADNGAAGDLYEDMHDVELLLKEAQTALMMLGPR
ncbi:MAG: hypothetical protein R3C68_07840 [Myxococcota bacterium]